MRSGLEDDPLLSGLLDAMDVAMMIVDRELRIIFANEAMVRAAGAASREAITGRRHGEAVCCVHAGEQRCSESDFCQACGVARAIAARSADEVLLTVTRGDGEVAREYAVRATPLELHGEQVTVVSFRDISDEKRREALEQVFFHDILNTITCLHGYTELLGREEGPCERKIVDHIVYLGDRLRREVLDQRALLEAERGTLDLQIEPVAPDAVLGAVEQLYTGHLLVKGQVLHVERDATLPELATDLTLLLRVILNMVKNAFEAGRREDPVRLWAERAGAGCAFCVHNRGLIPPEVARLVFKRTFSTKATRGRGLGTYSMRLFGERYLGGQVGFTTSAEAGTVFSITLPLEP